MHSTFVSAASVAIFAMTVLGAPKPQGSVPSQALTNPKPDDPCKGTTDPSCYYWPQNYSYYLTAYATAAPTTSSSTKATTSTTMTTTTHATTSTTSAAATSSPYYVTVTACSKAQQTGSATAWTGTECEHIVLVNTKAQWSGSQQVSTMNSAGYYSTGMCVPLSGHNVAINAAGWGPLSCSISPVSNCQPITGDSTGASVWHFGSTVYNTTGQALYPGSITPSYGEYLQCLAPGQPAPIE